MSKKTIYSGIMMLMLLLPFAAGASRLSVEAGNLERGKTNTLRFLLDNPDQEFYGFQADVWLPYGVEPTRGDNGELAVSLSDRADKGGYSLTANVLTNGEVRMGTYSTNKIPFSGDSGVLVNMEVYVAPDFCGGDVTIGNILMIDRESNDIQLDSFSENVSPVVEVASVWFDRAEMTMTEGDEGWLYVNIEPWDATDQTIVWSSSDESIATIWTEDGRNARITAVKDGEATITASAPNGISASCIVRVEKRFVDVLGIFLNQDNATLTEGDSMTLTVTIDPMDATDRTINWWVSDESVANVNANGTEATVTAIAPGYVEIHAQSSNGMVATCHINVEARYIEVSDIVLDRSELNLTEGDITTLIATVNPSDATDKTLAWTSSDASVASVSADGEVTALKEGTATITVSSSNGISATCRITVEARIIEMESIVLDVESLDLEVGDTHQLVATVYPADATDRELEWWVDDENVATVDHSGFVKMIGEGTSTVHVRSVRWNHIEATCHLDVSADVESLISDGSPCDVYTAEGLLIWKSAIPSRLADLPRGLYLIRQRDTTIKLLK